MKDNLASSSFTLQVDNNNISFLSEASRWGKFLSILGFVLCGIIVLCALFANTLISSAFKQVDPQFANLGAAGGIIVAIYYLIIGLLYFFPSLYLFNFSSKMQTAIRNNDQVSLNNAFKNLKSCFKFWGILVIIGLCVIGVAIIFGTIGVALSR